MSLVSEKTQMETEIWNIISGCEADPRSVIIGCGGAAVRIMERVGWQFRSIPRVILNTDMTGLQNVDADRKICIGKSITFNNDSGGFMEVTEKCAELASDEIRSCLISKNVAFIIAGYGGGTGTALAPMVARMAKGLGMVTFAICILPFSAEGTRRERAEENIEAIRAVADSAIILDNDSLLRFGDDITLDRAFRIMDSNVVKLIKDVTESMSRDYLATLAGEIMAYQSEMALTEGNVMVLSDAENLAVADDNRVPQSAYPQPCDMNLINSGGMFQRS